MTTSEASIIARHIRSNLSLAFDVANRDPQVHEQLLQEGLATIKEALHTEIPHREFEIADRFSPDPKRRWSPLSARHRDWPTGITVDLEADAHGPRDLFIGIRAKPPAIIPTNLNAALTKRVRAGGATGNWAWWYRLDAYRHWDERNAVIAFGSGNAPKELAAQLLTVIHAVDQLLRNTPTTNNSAGEN